MAKYRELLLPVLGKKIMQDASSQGVSLASELLYKEVIAQFDNIPLKALELGGGCGIVSIMCALLRPAWDITLLEIQSHLTELARENAQACSVKLNVLCEDLLEHNGQYDLIYANPPWRKLNSGQMSPYHERNISRFELQCTMQDILQAIERNLKQAGIAVLIYPQERIKDLSTEIDKTLLDIIKHRIHDGNKAFSLACIKHREIL